MKLVSMTDFVLEQVKKMEPKELAYLKIFNYAKFLNQPLTLGMFVTCDSDGNVLEEPKNYDLWCKYGDFTQYGKSLTKECKEYKEAKERIFFEGNFSFMYGNLKVFEKQCIGGLFSNLCYEGLTVEDLISDYKPDFEIRKPIIKQLGLL